MSSTATRWHVAASTCAHCSTHMVESHTLLQRKKAKLYEGAPPSAMAHAKAAIPAMAVQMHIIGNAVVNTATQWHKTKQLHFRAQTSQP